MTALENKLAELENGTVIIYDKQLVLSMEKAVKKIILVEQLESCFVVRYATDREIMRDYKARGLSNKSIELKIYLEEVKSIWKKD
jgi:hypothetical protein